MPDSRCLREQEIRKKYDQRVFCCIKLETCAFIIGLFDLLLYTIVLPKLLYILAITFDDNSTIPFNITTVFSTSNLKSHIGRILLAFMLIACLTSITGSMLIGIVKKNPKSLLHYLLLKICDIIAIIGFSLFYWPILVYETENVSRIVYETSTSLNHPNLISDSLFLIIIIVIKVYCIYVIVKCYRLLKALKCARDNSNNSTDYDRENRSSHRRNNDERNIHQPPNYEDIIKISSFIDADSSNKEIFSNASRTSRSCDSKQSTIIGVCTNHSVAQENDDEARQLPQSTTIIFSNN
ncbi:hypothetical protein GJ496_001311 [Pomphorhynchus laevis]|nr:hypothetical protein GJ496_001311 [Pomphorhynchus laevis]